MSDNVVESVRSDVRKLERLINNCRHGGPSPDSFCLSEAQRLLMWDPTPTDMLLIPSSLVGGDDQIIVALHATINAITDPRTGFPRCLRDAGSRKYFAAVAVDAWAEDDFLNVRKFLTKSIILYHLQGAGVKRTLEELDRAKSGAPQDRNSLLQRVKGILQCHNQGLKAYLEFCTDGACNCIGLAQILNDEKELILNPNADRGVMEARRKQREEERLPPVLKHSSKYWKLKNKAAECLQKKKLDYAMKLYLKAKTMLDQQKDFEAPVHQAEWLFKIGDESGKIASNLSYICLMQDDKQKALEYADESVTACPGWSKSYYRRALALKSLGQLEEAQVAIFNALKKCQKELSRGEVDKKRLKEYQDIQTEIQGMIASNANQGQSLSIENPLCQPLDCKPGSDEVGSVGSIASNQDIMDNIYSFLTPVDFAKLECTCKQFAIDAERGRRIATASNLLFKIQSTDQSGAGEVAFAKYVESVNDSPIKALQKFISEVHHMIDDDGWKEYISIIKMFPLALKTIIDIAFCNASEPRARTLFRMLDIDFGSSRDFQIVKFLLSDNNALRPLKLTLLSQLSDLDDEEGNFARRFIHHSVDMEVMRLSISAINDVDDHMYGGGMKDTALILLNNTILSKGGHRRQKINPEDPLYSHGMAFHALFSELIPDEWPGLVNDTFSFESDEIERDAVGQFWEDQPEMSPMWRLAILKSLKWVRDVEKEGCSSEYLLVNRLALGEMMDRFHSPINFISFGAFLVMKAIEYGGSISMSTKLRTEEDLTDFFCGYYDFLHVFSAGFPILVKFMDSVVAEHHSYMG